MDHVVSLWDQIENAVLVGRSAVVGVRKRIEEADDISETDRQMMLGRCDTYLYDFDREQQARRGRPGTPAA